MKPIINLVPSYKRNINPQTFLNLSNEEKRDIRFTKFVPPALGESGFGHFVITLKKPTYCVFNDPKK